MKKQPEVLAVILSCHRRDNIQSILDALRAQTVPCHIAIVDCGLGHDTGRPVYAGVIAQADSYFACGVTDPGPVARFIAPLMLPQFPYTFFAVDDHLPGKRCVEWMLKTLKAEGWNYTSVGQDGRNIVDGEIIKRKARLQATGCTPIDFITSSELCKTALVPTAMQFFACGIAGHNHSLGIIREQDKRLSAFEDDLIFNLGLQLSTKKPCLLTPEPPAPEFSWRAKRLPDGGGGLSARPDHEERRRRFVRVMTEKFGWRSWR